MIDAQCLTLSAALSLGHFMPASVQREYQWQPSHARRLLDDVLGAFERAGLDPGEASTAPDEETPTDDDKDHQAAPGDAPLPSLPPTRAIRRGPRPPDHYYLGSLILLKGRRDTRHFIYDGLQRLTTITLLLARLRDSWQSPSEVEALALTQHLYEAEQSPRVRVQTPARTLADTLAARKLRWGEMSAGDRNMREVSTMFADLFADWNDERRRAFLEFFTRHIILTVVYVEHPSLAYQIFVAANARGLDLEIGDITKGQLVELVAQNGGNRALIEATAAEWTRAQRLLRSGFDDFLNAVEILKFRPERKHALGELLLDLFDETSDPAEISAFVTDELAHMARVFLPARKHLAMTATSGIDLSFRQLSFLRWKDWQPFFLALALAHEEKPEMLARSIPKLQRACFMLELIGWSERTRRRTFIEAIRQLENGIDPFRARQKGKVYGSLYFSSKFKAIARQNLRAPFIEDDRRGSIARWIETLHWGEEVPRSCTDDATIEHVLPRAAVGEWQKRFNEEERERLTNRLGNLCLLPEEKNADLGNKDWLEKVKVYETMTGRFRGADIVAKIGKVAGGASQSGTWNPAAIEAATEYLASLAEQALEIA